MPEDLHRRSAPRADDVAPDGRAEAAAFDDDAVPLRALDEPRATSVETDDGGPAGPDADDSDEGDEGDDVVVLSWWQHPVNVAALVVAMALIGGMVGWLIADAGRDDRGSAVDIGFLHDMRAHHEQAVEMAYTYLGLPDTDPGLRTVAGSILVGQNIDIGRMIQMLRDMHAPEAAETDEAMGWMGMPTTQEQMPGMATDAQLTELRSSSGAAADALFGELMIAHHEGGIHMAEVAATEASLAKVRSMATSMVNGQQGDIAEIRQLLG